MHTLTHARSRIHCLHSPFNLCVCVCFAAPGFRCIAVQGEPAVVSHGAAAARVRVCCAPPHRQTAQVVCPLLTAQADTRMHALCRLSSCLSCLCPFLTSCFFALSLSLSFFFCFCFCLDFCPLSCCFFCLLEICVYVCGLALLLDQTNKQTNKQTSKRQYRWTVYYAPCLLASSTVLATRQDKQMSRQEQDPAPSILKTNEIERDREGLRRKKRCEEG